eukprot:g10502.t1
MASTQQTPTFGLRNAQRLRSTLRGEEDAIFNLVCARTTLEQWVEWLRTPLEHAVAAGNEDLSAKLDAAGARAKAVHPAVRGGREALVNELLRIGAYPGEPDENGDTPLHVAVQGGHGDILSLLLQEGAAVDRLDMEGRSPLHLAAGAEGAENDCGQTPLHRASANCNAQATKALLRGDADQDEKDGDWESPLHLVGAAESGEQKDKIPGRSRNFRARGATAAAASDGVQASTAPPGARPVRGLSDLVAGVVTFEEESVFRNIVKCL